MIKRVLISLFSLMITAEIGSAETKRPKIGLVLGGGGALGLAHIGVIEVLEELQIPIDYIGGTSMGAIVAGMYASGMSPQEMKQNFIKLNWWNVLKDRSPNQYLTYRRKFENKRYMGTEFGLKNWHILYSPGMAYGQKLNNVLEVFSLNGAGITDFDQLNIPYRAVTTDIRAGESVTLKSGSLAQAMRASMAVPGVFTPVFIDDKVFVDGGIFNNIPVDVVREMGADIIIAVDVGESGAIKGQGNDFQSLGEVIARTYTIMQRPGQEEQLKHADIVIAPDMSDSAPSHFHKAKKIIPKGRDGAEKVSKQLATLSVNDEEFAAFLKKQRTQHTDIIEITDVSVIGNSAIPEQAILPHIKSQPGPLELSTVHEDLNRIHGLGHFQTVTFNLKPNDEGYELTYAVADKFWGPQYLHFGLRFEMSTDSTILWSILLNYTHMQLNESGAELRIDLEGGGYKRFVKSEWYQPLSKAGYFFVAPSVTLSDEDIELYDGNDVIAEVEQSLVYAQFDAGFSLFEYGEFRMGLLGGHAYDEGNSGLIYLGELSDAVVAATTQFRLDQLDDPVFPTRGYKFSVDGMFASEEIGSSKTFSRLDAMAMKPISIGRHTIIPALSLGSSFGTELPFYSIFNLGGEDTFAGFAPYQLTGNYYGIGSIGYRYRMGKLPPTLGNGVFAMTRLDAGNAWFDSDNIGLDDLSYGALVGVAADTILGTCVFSVGKANDINNMRFYFSLGNHF